MKKPNIILISTIIMSLTGCSGAPTLGDQMIERGKKLVNEGNAEFEQGSILVEQGKAKIERGNRMIEDGKEVDAK
ncbi:MAG: hypothetical protein PHG00_06060 [Methylococcales bacterium]|nr:hypothetical protein [Methylococcales bacterium]